MKAYLVAQFHCFLLMPVQFVAVLGYVNYNYLFEMKCYADFWVIFLHLKLDV